MKVSDNLFNQYLTGFMSDTNLYSAVEFSSNISMEYARDIDRDTTGILYPLRLYKILKEVFFT